MRGALALGESAPTCPTCTRNACIHTRHATQETHVAPVIADYWEKAEFPHPLVPSFAALGLAGGPIKGYGCPVSE